MGKEKEVKEEVKRGGIERVGGERGGMDRRLIIVFLTILPLLTGPVLSDCENSEGDELELGGATFNETHELSETLEEEGVMEEEEEESEEDAEEAFNDLEDETMLCADYVPQTRNKRLPDAIIIGARKGGTRALLEFANMHPKILRAKREIHFFDKHWEKGSDWYIEQMPSVMEGQVCMEKTPGYFHEAPVPRRIFETNNSTKLVLIVRNPVDRLISDYNQFRSRKLDRGEEYPSLEEFLFTQSGNIDIGYQPLQRSIYHYHLVRWMRYFPLSQIHIVDGDRFIKEPWVGLKQLEEFLEISPEITEENFFFNATKGFYCGLQEMTVPTQSPHVWTCTRRTCLSKSKGRPKPPVEPETYQKLYRFFERHNQIFFSLINKFDFDWTYKPKLPQIGSGDT